MGVYTYLHAKIRNTDIDEVVRCMIWRYSAWFCFEEFKDKPGGSCSRNGRIISLVPMEHISCRQEGKDVHLEGSVKGQGYQYGREHDLSFGIIPDICREMGDAVLSVSDARLEYFEMENAGREVTEEEYKAFLKKEEIYSGEEFPAKERKPQPPFNAERDMRSLACDSAANYFYKNYMKEGAGGAKDVIPECPELYRLYEDVYKNYGYLLFGEREDDRRTYFALIEMALTLGKRKEPDAAENDGTEDSDKINVPDMKNLPLSDLVWYLDKRGLAEGVCGERTASFFGARFYRLVPSDLQGLARAFYGAGNKTCGDYCRKAAAAMQNAGRICGVLPGNYNMHIRPACALTEDAENTAFDIGFRKTFGWGFRNFHDLNLEFRADAQGVRLTEYDVDDGRGYVPFSGREGLWKDIYACCSLPVIAGIAGHYISGECLERIMEAPGPEEAKKEARRGIRRTRDGSYASLFPDLFGDRRFFLDRLDELAERFYGENRTYVLNVPFDEKEEAKEAGAFWNMKKKKWMIGAPCLTDEVRKKWLPKGAGV